MHGKSKLFTADGPIVNEKAGYDCAGSGLYLANFICSRTYLNSMSLSQATILAAYVLFQAKEHVEGCGGESHIAVLNNAGKSGGVESAILTGINNQLKQMDKHIEHLLVSAVDLDLTEEQYKRTQALFLHVVSITRGMHKKQREDWEELQKALSGLGTPKPSDAENSKDQQ